MLMGGNVAGIVPVKCSRGGCRLSGRRGCGGLLGVGALLGPEGTGPASCSRVRFGGRGVRGGVLLSLVVPVLLVWVYRLSPCLVSFREWGGGGCGGGVGRGRGKGRGWVFVNWIVDASI